MKMFARLRLRLALHFTALASLIYVVLGSIACSFFYSGLTDAIDTVLEDVATSLDAAVLVIGQSAKFNRRPLEHVHLREEHAMPTVQLWTTDRILQESYGPRGHESFLPGEAEIRLSNKTLRSFNRPVLRNSKIIAFIQVQLPLAGRDEAMREFLEAILCTAPLLIGSLGAAGYFFAGRAVKPVEDSFALLKQFSADAGHELKTPVAIIRSACDNLAADLKDNAAARERLDVIHRTTERMEKLIADLLVLTKAEQVEQPVTQIESVDVEELDMILREILGEFGDLFEEKEIELYAEELEPCKVQADKDTLYKIFSNLLRNCARYTDAGGKVTVSLSRQAEQGVVVVSDTGIGIPPESLDKIFDRFYRVDESRARTGGGSGLGLAIVKALVEKLRGSIAVESEVGKGSRFTVRLPLV